MAKVRGEYIRLGSGPSYGGGGWPNVLEGRPIDNFQIEVTETATTVNNGPIVPAFTQDGGRNASTRGHVRLISDADMYLEIFDATDTENVVASTRDRSFFLQSGVAEVIPVITGQRMSFITGAL